MTPVGKKNSRSPIVRHESSPVELFRKTDSSNPYLRNKFIKNKHAIVSSPAEEGNKTQRILYPQSSARRESTP
jgi:hypothetical protein